MSFDIVTPKQAYQRMQEGWLYLDVRTEEEFAAGYATGALNIPLFTATPQGRELNAEFLAEVQAAFPATAKLVIGCASGGRSGKACELLSAAGYAHVANIDGGFVGRSDPATGTLVQAGWKAEGLPVSKAGGGCGSPKCGCGH